MPYIKLPSYMLETVQTALEIAEKQVKQSKHAATAKGRAEIKAYSEAWEYIDGAQVLNDNQALVSLTGLPKLAPRVDISDMDVDIEE